MSKDSKEEVKTPLGILTYSEKENCLHHNPQLNSMDWNKVEVWLFKTVSDLQSSEKDKRIKALDIYIDYKLGEIESLQNRIKELEEELSQFKSNAVCPQCQKTTSFSCENDWVDAK